MRYGPWILLGLVLLGGSLLGQVLGPINRLVETMYFVAVGR
jgi:hypothetical protein